MEKKATEHKRRGCVPTLRYLCFRKLGKEPRPEGFSTSPRKIDSFSLDTEKDEKSKKKQTVEQGSRKVDVNHTEAEQDSTQDQAKPRREQVVPKFGEWCGSDPVPDDGYAHIFNKARDERRGALNDEFHKVKTFDLRGVKSDGRDKDQ
ncbi:RPM1-interacting protein 4-like [Brassica napus]|nr:RPM1-interacting protein 4-like [Brassica napus]